MLLFVFLFIIIYLLLFIYLAFMSVFSGHFPDAPVCFFMIII